MPAAPKTLAAATRLLERYADLQADFDRVEAARSARLAAVNAAADADAGPLAKQMLDLHAALEPWWTEQGSTLAQGKKSLQLGGCMIGSRMGKPSLAHAFPKDEDAVTALLATRYKKQTTQVKYSLDKVGTRKLLELGGKAAEQLKDLGFSIKQDDKFFVERVEQPATIGG